MPRKSKTSSKKVYAPIYYKLPYYNAPDFIKARLTIDIEKLQDFIDEHASDKDKYLNFDLTQSNDGKFLITLNDYKKKESD